MYYWSKEDVRAVAVQIILGLRAWTDYGRKVTKTLLVEMLAWAASSDMSLSGAAVYSRRASDESFRKALLANLPTLDVLRGETSTAFRKSLPRRLRRVAVTVVIDYHKRPYYGVAAATPGVRGGKEEASTRWFWTYASASIITRGERFAVALEPIFHQDKMEDVLERLWQQMAKIPLKIKLLMLDREFCAADPILWLQRRKVPFILPLIRRGKFGSTKDRDQGNTRFFRRGNKGISTYEWKPRSSSRTRELIKVNVACVPRGRRRPLVYVVSQQNWSLTWIKKTYQRRFGIESTYRQLGQALAQTTTRMPQWRFLLVTIALLLRNVWVLCRQLARKPVLIIFKTILIWIAEDIISKGPSPIDGFHSRKRPVSTVAALI